MRKKRPDTVECPVELTRFQPKEWPASERDVELMGPSEHLAFHAWIRWIHARADFADRHDVDYDSIPNRTTAAVRAVVRASVGGPHG